MSAHATVVVKRRATDQVYHHHNRNNEEVIPMDELQALVEGEQPLASVALEVGITREVRLENENVWLKSTATVTLQCAQDTPHLERASELATLKATEFALTALEVVVSGMGNGGGG